MTSIIQPPTPEPTLHPLSTKLISFVQEDIDCQKLLIEAVKQFDCIRNIHEISAKIVRENGIYVLGIFGKPKGVETAEGMLKLLPQYSDATEHSITFRSGFLGDRTTNIMIAIGYNPPVT